MMKIFRWQQLRGKNSDEKRNDRPSTSIHRRPQLETISQPKDLSISICLEAAELLEVFQWSADDTECSDKIDRIREELADVLNYCILMADAYGLDLDEIILEKTEEK